MQICDSALSNLDEKKAFAVCIEGMEEIVSNQPVMGCRNIRPAQRRLEEYQIIKNMKIRSRLLVSYAVIILISITASVVALS